MCSWLSPNSTLHGNCLRDLFWNESITVETSIAFYNRSAKVAYSVFNSSILSVSELSDPSAVRVEPSDLLRIFDLFFSNFTQDIPNYTFPSLLDNLILQLHFGDETTVFSSTYYLQSILTLPIILFQSNGVIKGQCMDYSSAPNLSPQMHTTGQFTQSVNRIVLAEWTVVVFTFFAVLIYVWCLGCLSWAMTIQGPKISTFALIDFASRISSAGNYQDSMVPIMASVAHGSMSIIRESLQTVHLFFGEITREQRRVPRREVDLGRRFGFLTRGRGMSSEYSDVSQAEMESPPHEG